MTPQELAAILECHAKWLRGEDSGERADLRGANLCGADLDSASWPLWCSSFGAQIYGRIASQLIAHLARCEGTDWLSRCIIAFVRPWRNAFCQFRSDVKEIA